VSEYDDNISNNNNSNNSIINNNNISRGGVVRIFEYKKAMNEWIQIGGSISGNGDNIGNGISLSYNGYSIAIAAPPRYYINGPFSYRESDGHVLVYTFDHSLSISSPSTLIVKKNNFVSSY
jgi:hypothetical protein